MNFKCLIFIVDIEIFLCYTEEKTELSKKEAQNA